MKHRLLLMTFTFVGISLSPVVGLIIDARASILTQTISPFTGDPLAVEISLDDMVSPGDIKITVEVITNMANPNTGDLRGLFLDISNDSLLGGLSVINAPDVTEFDQSGSVVNLGNGANLNGGGAGNSAPFDMGFEIGTQGIGGDDIFSTMFTLTHNSVSLDNSLFVGEDLGVRATSVGLPGDRAGSSKLGGTFDPPIDPNGGTIPEPTSFLVWALMATAVVCSKRRC